MMKPNKFLSLLGLCMRAGMLLTGEEIALKAVQSQQAKLVILSTDASDNTRKKFMDKCNYYRIPYMIRYTREELGIAIGKANRVVIAIADKGFAEALIACEPQPTEVKSID